MVQLTKEWKGLVDADTGTVSREIFWSKDLYDQEMEQVFARSWLFVGHDSQIPNPGRLHPGAHGRRGSCRQPRSGQQDTCVPELVQAPRQPRLPVRPGQLVHPHVLVPRVDVRRNRRTRRVAVPRERVRRHEEGRLGPDASTKVRTLISLIILIGRPPLAHGPAYPINPRSGTAE